MLYKMSQYYPKPFDRSSGNVKVELDLSSYATKAHLKGAAGVDTSNLAAKSDLASLKAKVDTIDIGKLNTIPVDLSKLSIIEVKKTVYGKVPAEVNIDTSRFF